MIGHYNLHLRGDKTEAQTAAKVGMTSKGWHWEGNFGLANLRAILFRFSPT